MLPHRPYYDSIWFVTRTRHSRSNLLNRIFITRGRRTVYSSNAWLIKEAVHPLPSHYNKNKHRLRAFICASGAMLILYQSKKNLSDQGNSKLVVLTSGRPAFRRHVEHAESGDTPLASHMQKDPERRVYKPQFRQKRKRPRSPAGPRRLGTATRISASLSRRLSAFFGSTHDQAPKAAKYAVLTPGHAGFPKRAERSEGSDTIPHPKHHLFRRVCPCVRFFSESRVCTHFHS